MHKQTFSKNLWLPTTLRAILLVALTLAVWVLVPVDRVAAQKPDWQDHYPVKKMGGNPGITVYPPSLAFGDQDVEAGTTTSQLVSITNNGSTDLHISDVSLSGAGAGEFAITSDSGEATLTPGNTRTVQVAFDPTTTGAKSANLTIQSDDSNRGTVNVALSGTGVDPTGADPEITVTPTDLTFGDQDVDAGATTSQLVSITNDGSTDLHISDVSLSGAGAGEFAITSDSGETTLAPGNTRTVQVAFDPTTTGAKSANLTIQSDDDDEGTLNVVLSGTGVAPEITVTPSSLAFGEQDVDAGETASQLVIF